jgi:hypothetical protein
MPCTHSSSIPGCASCAAKLLGAAGGAVTGASKARGGPDYYRALAAKRRVRRGRRSKPLT